MKISSSAARPRVITKRDLVNQISEQTGLTHVQIFEMVQLLIKNMTAFLASGHEVVMRNFGTFEVRVQRAKVGRNPHHPETDVPIPARAVVKFTAGKELKEKVLALTPEA